MDTSSNPDTRRLALLAAPQPGTWLGVVPWVGLGLLAAAVGLSVCEMRTPILHLGMSFSAGQLLIGPAILAFLVHQVLGALWGLVARRGDGPCGVRTALADSALASLHCTMAWLPVLLIPWFLGNVSAALTLRILAGRQSAGSAGRSALRARRASGSGAGAPTRFWRGAAARRRRDRGALGRLVAGWPAA